MAGTGHNHGDLMMRAALLALLLAACSYSRGPGALEANIIAPGNFKTGSGVIRNVGVLPNANKTGSRSGNRPPDPNLYRLLIQMDATGFQSVDIDAAIFLVGEVIDITNDGRVVRLSGTSFNKLFDER
jgi:hypothetical protein